MHKKLEFGEEKGGHVLPFFHSPSSLLANSSFSLLRSWEVGQGGGGGRGGQWDRDVPTSGALWYCGKTVSCSELGRCLMMVLKSQGQFCRFFRNHPAVTGDLSPVGVLMQFCASLFGVPA